MNSSKSSPKRASKVSFKEISPFDMFYQLTYMSAMASAGLTRSKIFIIAEQSTSSAADYFKAINTLVVEFRYDYAEACRHVGTKAKSDNMRSFLLRLSDALRSGEPLAEFLAREAEVQNEDYESRYDRSLESLKQWSNAFSSIVISVALIIIIQVISSMIYSSDVSVMAGLVATGVIMSGFAAWIIWRSAPRETMTVPAAQGSPEQRRAMRLFRLITPLAISLAAVFYMVGIDIGIILIALAATLVPIGYISIRSDKLTNKKDEEFSTFLRSTGGMASASGTTLKEALKKIDLSSFPTLQPDIERLGKRLHARMDPELCWHKFGMESGSKLISEVTGIFYGAVKIGGDPERVGYLCSLFTAKTSQLRAKRRLTAGTFAGLTTVMQAVIAGLMVFVLSIVETFAAMVVEMMPDGDRMTSTGPTMSMGMAQFTPEDLQFLSTITVTMVVLLAVVSAAAVIFTTGGYKLKVTFYLAITMFISGVSLLLVPPMVTSILTI
jgi:flagellar protein FlaJ